MVMNKIGLQQTNKNHSKELKSKSGAEKYQTEIKHSLAEFQEHICAGRKSNQPTSR